MIPEKVIIREIGPRENLKFFLKGLSVEDKVAIIDALSDTGISRIEAVFFGHPRINTHTRDAEEVVKRIKKRPGVKYGGLVVDEIGCRRALECELDEITVFSYASKRWEERMLGLPGFDSFSEVYSIMDAMAKAGIRWRGIVGTAFVCPYEGKTPVEKVVDMALQFEGMGASEVCLGDDVGGATPKHIEELVGKLTQFLNSAQLSVHLHNIRGQGLANISAALRVGVRVIDTSIGGLGKYVGLKNSMSLIATEDVVSQLERDGFVHGIDTIKLGDCIQLIRSFMEQKEQILEETILP